MIEIHQAIFGQGRDRGHALLNSSYPTDTIPNQISGFTDLVDRPTSGILATPIVRGFLVKDNFLLIKSFPDLAGRHGRVFSHALVLKKDDYLKVHDVSDLLQYHLTEINKEAVTDLIFYKNDPVRPIEAVTGRMINATDAMINHLEYENTISWIGDNEYWSWISRIWPQIPQAVKTKIRIGTAFNAKNINKDTLNLICIPAELRSNWHREKCAIIDDQDAIQPETNLIRFFNGQSGINNDLSILMSELSPNISEIDDIKILANYIELYKNLNKNTPIKDLLVFADLITRYNSDSRSVVSAKNKIIDAIARELKHTTAEEVFFLQHQTWKGYDEKYVNLTLGKPLENWLSANLIIGKVTLEKSKIAAIALKAKVRYWWHEYISDFIQNSMKKWHPSHAFFLWSWIKADPSIGPLLIPGLPHDAEKDLLAQLPEFDKSQSEIIISVAFEKKWLRLYGMVALGAYGSKDAFSKVLAINDSELIPAVLESMATKIPDQQLVSVAVELCDFQLTILTAKKITLKPALKGPLIVSNKGWQHLWVESIKNGVNVWEGIASPDTILVEIMNLLVNGEPIEPILLKEISISKYNNLKNYHKRASIWAFLHSDSKTSFLSATLAHCLNDVSVGTIQFGDLEKPLQDALASPAMRKSIITSNILSTISKLELFSRFHNFSESDALSLIQCSRFSNDEAVQLGVLVSTKNWQNLANDIFRSRQTRHDLEPALEQCVHLLGFWDRRFLYDKGYRTEAISEDEFWSSLLTKVIENYPDGPNQNGLWEISGGKRSHLDTGGSGQQIWTNAINHIKRGGRPTPKNLLRKMITDFPYDDSLKQLKKLL